MVTGSIVNGAVDNTYTDTNLGQKSTGDELGKDAFLQLLTTQLKYQDPLSPMENTEMVSQLAQFSALEAMQNVSATVANTQALSLVGKNVIIEVGKSSGSSNTSLVGGNVQYVQMVNGNAKLCIDGKLYDYEDLDMVVDDKYLSAIIAGSDKKEEESTGNTTTDKTENEKKEDSPSEDETTKG